MRVHGDQYGFVGEFLEMMRVVNAVLLSLSPKFVIVFIIVLILWQVVREGEYFFLSHCSQLYFTPS